MFRSRLWFLLVLLLLAACSPSSSAAPTGVPATPIAPTADQATIGPVQATATPEMLPKYTLKQLLDNPPLNAVRGLYLSPFSGRIYAGTEKGIAYFDGQWHAMPDTTKFRQVNAITEAMIGGKVVLLVGSDAFNDPNFEGGLHVFSDGKWSHPFTSTVFSFSVRRGPKDDNPRDVAATWEGLYQAEDDGSWTRIFSDQNLPFSQSIHAFAVLTDGTTRYDCFGLVNKGVGCLNQADPTISVLMNTDAPIERHLDSNEVRVFSRDIDSLRGVWVGTEGGGMVLVSLQEQNGNVRPVVLGVLESAKARKVQDIRYGPTGKQYIAALDSGTHVLATGQPLSSLDPAPANAVLPYGDLVIIGTTAGIHVVPAR